jgi:hypothetical protein
LPLTPPRDATGDVVPHDDPEVLDTSMLMRRINRIHVVPDENTGRQRLSSGAFSATNGDPNDGMSVDLGQLLDEAGIGYAEIVPDGMGAVAFEASSVRALQLQVGSDPEEDNPFHGQVWGVKKPKRGKIQALDMRWIVELPGVSFR